MVRQTARSRAAEMLQVNLVRRHKGGTTTYLEVLDYVYKARGGGWQQ
jgi:3-deoxy-D-manno-octulosonate 8-phosphate phosphatase KdsC-like HAD superfamily phosphatase